MGTNLPTTIPELINWCVAHDGQWTANATQINLTTAQTTAYHTIVQNLTKANDTAEAARMASKEATMQLQNAIDAARGLSSVYVDIIKNYAESTHNMNVYALGAISPPSPPGTPPLPVAPDKFGASVNPDGSLTIKWKVAQPTGATGVQYRVLRRVNATSGPYSIVSTEGSNKSFTDTFLPVGVDRVEYIVQPTRPGGIVGPQSNVFVVQFGSVSGGGISIARIESVPHAEPMRIAA
ncbi:MAG TPA: hypothetical protein PKE29_05630 [Phycisphaerales bacterium]|nr:hypothetical protein [Phycisphaerales bacterium]